jgi:hypothetical protein
MKPQPARHGRASAPSRILALPCSAISSVTPPALAAVRDTGGLFAAEQGEPDFFNCRCQCP